MVEFNLTHDGLRGGVLNWFKSMHYAKLICKVLKRYLERYLTRMTFSLGIIDWE